MRTISECWKCGEELETDSDDFAPLPVCEVCGQEHDIDFNEDWDGNYWFKVSPKQKDTE